MRAVTARARRWFWIFWLSFRQIRAPLTPPIRLLFWTGLGITALAGMGILLTHWIVEGFRQEILQKLFWFTGHLEVRMYTPTPQPFTTPPFHPDPRLASAFQQTAEVYQWVPYYSQPILLVRGFRLAGGILRAVPRNFLEDPDWRTFLREGNPPASPQEIVLSREIARELNVVPGDTIQIFLEEEHIRPVRVVVSGIFQTGIEELDRVFVFGWLSAMSGWKKGADSLLSGVLVFLRNPREYREIQHKLLTELPFMFTVFAPEELIPNLFDWLHLHRLNQGVLTVLLLTVAIVNIIGLLITFALERMPFLGVLAATGWTVRELRLYMVATGMWVILLGLSGGILVAFLLAWIQQKTCLISLPEESYYVRCVPLYLEVWGTLLLPAKILGIALITLILSSVILPLRKPAEALRFGFFR